MANAIAYAIIESTTMTIRGRRVKKRVLGLIALALGIIGFTFWFFDTYQILPASAYVLFQEAPSPKSSDKILIVSPHPDDETLGAGGFIARAVNNKADVEVIIATDGNKRGLKAQRHQETLNAMSDLGVPNDHVVFFDFPDSKLKSYQSQFNSELLAKIDSFQPTIILGTLPADTHPDHSAVGVGIDTDIRSLNIHPVVYQFLIHYHRFPRPATYSPNSNLLPPAILLSSSNNWQKFDLTTSEEQAKERAIEEYKSQLSLENPFLHELMFSFIRKNELFVIVQS